MITADEAREIKRHYCFATCRRELKNIELEIRRAAEKGETKINSKGLLHSETRAELERCGYKVKVADDRNELYTTISWED